MTSFVDVKDHVTQGVDTLFNKKGDLQDFCHGSTASASQAVTTAACAVVRLCTKLDSSTTACAAARVSACWEQQQVLSSWCGTDYCRGGVHLGRGRVDLAASVALAGCGGPRVSGNVLIKVARCLCTRGVNVIQLQH